MVEEIGPSTPWSLEGHAVDFYGASQGYSYVDKHMQGMYHGEVCKGHFSCEGELSSREFTQMCVDHSL